MSTPSTMLGPQPIALAYEADLLGNIQQALAGLQGFDVMALELIQNADDAGAKKLAFDVRDRTLVVRNNGRFSTCGLRTPRCPWETEGGPDGRARPCNFHAISRVGSRSKVHATGQIGRFGIGFVSVYQVTDAPIIRSAGIEMRLDPLRGTAPIAPVADLGGTEFELPWASMPSPTRQALNASPTPNNVAALLLDAIADVMARGLFFLRHLRYVELRQNGALERSVVIRRKGGLVALKIAPEARVERWKVLARDATDLAAERDIFTNYPTLAQLERSPIVNVAIPLTGDSIPGLLYAYLPTEQSSCMPLHINGDFFPHPNRRSIVLSGEQHERYWNELLLDTAARAIGDAFEELRDLLGGTRLWGLGNAAFEARDTKGFGAFWKAFSEAAKKASSVWTVGGEWCRPVECYLPPEQMPYEEQVALTSIGLNLLHRDLRPLWTVLSSLGATPLRLSTVVDALRARGERPDASLDTNLRSLWSAIDIMIESSRSRTGFTEALKQLKATVFLLNADEEPTSIDEVWRPPSGVLSEAIRSYVTDCRLVHPEVERYAAIWDTIGVYRFDDFAGHLAEMITDVPSAMSVVGADGASARRFYDLLTAFDIDPEMSRAGVILANVPMLRTLDGFVSPSRGRLPGGFADPIGHFELIDRRLLGEQMCDLARTVLKVDVLTFNDYVEDHLEEILATGPSREQYVALLVEIINHQAELDADGGLDPLAEQAFVRTRAGGYARPDDCYYWSATLEALLGGDRSNWVDEDWMPSGRAGSRIRDLLESRLGMRSTVSTRHLVDRITDIAESGSIDDIAARTAPIVRHILDRFPRMGSIDRAELERLRSIAFLPGAVNGERVQGKRFTPALVYRAFRASGFSSQVVAVDLPPLRGGTSGSSLIEFLDLLKMPAEPPTEKIVAHLETCITNGWPAPDTTYAILNERLDAPDAGCIDRLAGTDFIYDSELKRYLPARKVFWERPPFGDHWHAAAARMRQREPLFRRLGVIDLPTAANYAALLRETASQAHPSISDAEVHARCLAWLADALDQELPEAEEAVDSLHNGYALLNLKGEPVRTEEAVWIDSEGLAAPFGDVLDERLVAPPPVTHRTAIARLFRRVGVVPLSEIARLRLASIPDHRPAPEATDRLRERADLLLWLAPTHEFRRTLRDALSRVEIRLTDRLQVHAEITEFDPPARSPANSATAFYDSEGGVLHVRSDGEQSVNWSTAFRALFAEFEKYCQGVDMRPVVMTAAFVTSLPTRADAEQELVNSDYRPPEEGGSELPLGKELGGTPDEAPTDISAHEDDESEEIVSVGSDPRSDRETERDDVEADGEVVGGEANENVRDGSGLPAPGHDALFKSKADEGAFGAGPQEGAGRVTRPASGVPRSDSTQSATGSSTGGGSPRRDISAERQTRRSRMLAYVGTGGSGPDAERRAASGDDISNLIDLAAIAAALKYERARGWVPEEQPHTNPGYDIVSRSPDGAHRRLIEVKGLEGEWTERGVKLSHVQFRMAETHLEEFWIYVVENARDLQRQRVSAIANPFAKVEEYWFDNQWRHVSEERATAQDVNIRVGAQVRHSLWGTGTIIAAERRGIARFLTVDFGPIEGRRHIPFGPNLEFVD